MKIGNGIDIIEITRIKEKFEKNDIFLSKIFTKYEIEQTKNSKIKYQTLAGKWAAKEALSKAIGTGIGKKLHWLDIEILNDIDKKPTINLKKTIIKEFNIQSIELSISHSKDYAIASVIVIFDDSSKSY